MDKEINLKPVWNAVLEVYQEVAKICDRHHLRYYLTDGSAIGAVRHHGFIPWDDDFDMSMPRPDYEKFIEYAKTELPAHLKFLDWRNTPEIGYIFGKVQETRREKVEAVERQCGYMLSSGVYVDILPIDGYPMNALERGWIRSYTKILRALWRARFSVFANQSTRGKMLCCLGWIYAICMPWIRKPQDVMRRCEAIQKRHGFDESEFTGRASVYLSGLNRPPLPKQWWGEAVWMEFNGIKVPLPHDYDSYLRFYYGDYMKLPPKDRQSPSHEYKYRCAWWLGPTKEAQ